MCPPGQGTKHVLAAQVYLSISLVGFTRVISCLLLLDGVAGTVGTTLSGIMIARLALPGEHREMS